MHKFETTISPGNYEWNVEITYVAKKVGHKWNIEITSLDGDCPDNPSNLFWDIAQDRAEEHFYDKQEEDKWRAIDAWEEDRRERLEEYDRKTKEIA